MQLFFGDWAEPVLQVLLRFLGTSWEELTFRKNCFKFIMLKIYKHCSLLKGTITLQKCLQEMQFQNLHIPRFLRPWSDAEGTRSCQLMSDLALKLMMTPGLRRNWLGHYIDIMRRQPTCLFCLNSSSWRWAKALLRASSTDCGEGSVNMLGPSSNLKRLW